MLYFSNFKLEINNIVMRKAMLTFIIAGIVLASAGIWFFSPWAKSPVELVQFGVIGLVVAFGFFLAFRRLSSARRGEPLEDERSRNVLRKTAALSYYISLYLWVFILFIKDRIAYDTEVLLGSGILGMAVAFAVSWFFFQFSGGHEESN